MKFVVRLSVQVLDVYLIAIVRHENICVDPRVVSVSFRDCECVCLSLGVCLIVCICLQ